jgi:hypothetical protein
MEEESTYPKEQTELNEKVASIKFLIALTFFLTTSSITVQLIVIYDHNCRMHNEEMKSINRIDSILKTMVAPPKTIQESPRNTAPNSPTFIMPAQKLKTITLPK